MDERTMICYFKSLLRDMDKDSYHNDSLEDWYTCYGKESEDEGNLLVRNV